MTRRIIPKTRLKLHTVTRNKEEVPEEDRVVEETLLEEEVEEEYDVMHVERQGTCLGNAPRKRKKEEKLTFQKHKEEMLKKKEQRMEHP
jgi:hypothetical protein